MAALTQSRLVLPGVRRGKVRDVYPLPGSATVPVSGGARLLIVASDRISAFDVVMPTPITGKGRLLTELSMFWQAMIEARGICQTHVISGDVNMLHASVFPADQPRELYEGRVVICKAAKVIPIECVVRGYLEGSGWKEYQASGSVCGVKLPAGLRQCDVLPEPIFTPATKEEMGKHDENISFERACELVGRETMEMLRRTSLQIYLMASEHARDRGIIIADTKFEFGLPVDEHGHVTSTTPMLIDEALTPDSSRFWPVDGYTPGGPQKSFDKQYLREFLERLVAAGKWNKQDPGPQLPDEIVAATVAKYAEAKERLMS
ncbi:MAG TPA: phosphoribosylaminoimidazolesuccinocarboxamide synthase [Phycisphaerales bacterium]|nr:phosphoribosylaminoimidazolesuccinocarboxamide synthase [Phycisphaerales bacterium]